jgi:YfiR/HmsC-like
MGERLSRRMNRCRDMPACRMQAARRYLGVMLTDVLEIAAVAADRNTSRLSALAAASRSFGLVSLCLLLAGQGAAAALPEYKSKAALIFKIGKFVRWPDAAFTSGDATLRVCIVGNDDFGASIDSLAGQMLQGRAIVIARLTDPGQSATQCRIAFISVSERARVQALLQSLARSPVLTISDIDGFSAQGGMIGLSSTANKIHFEINAAASKRAGLEIGAQLLQLATLIDVQRTESRP